MTLRTYLTQHAWWGKVLGAGLGFLMAGPPGALFGVFIGNLFDRGLSDHFSRPHWTYHSEKRAAVKQAFQRATFSVMGHIAKADGQVTEEEILFAKKVMRELNLGRAERTAAQTFFTQGKAAKFDIKEPVLSFKHLAKDSPKLLHAFIQLQYKAAQVSGLAPQKILILNRLLNLLDFAPLHEQAHAREHFYSQFNQQQGPWREHYTSHHTSKPPIENAYTILNVAPDASQQEVKRAYRKQISLHHPDRHIAKGHSEESIKQANEKTQAIRKAYEAICEHHGW